MIPFRFYLITDRLHARVDPLLLLPKLAGAGLKALQVREKDLSPILLYQYAQKVQKALGKEYEAGEAVELFLNDRADIALSLSFKGVHLREESLPLAAHGETLRKALSFGVSTHSLAGVLAAEKAGADFATFGPVFSTLSKASLGDPAGIKTLEKITSQTKLPLLALGGITPENCRECLAAGAEGVAAISALWNSPDPLKALSAFGEALGGL